MTPTEIAQVCHEANRALQEIQADPTNPVSPPWAELDAETAASAVQGVEHRIATGASPEEMHENWCTFKRDAGWVYGEVKDVDAKTHPCLVPYDELPASQQVKDHLFSAIVDALTW